MIVVVKLFKARALSDPSKTLVVGWNPAPCLDV
jgi:hypothetical protein